MTTPTKLEIEHAERFEALGLFRDAPKPIIRDVEFRGSKIYHYDDIFAVDAPRIRIKELGYGIIGPLPSCEEIWPVILELYRKKTGAKSAHVGTSAYIGCIIKKFDDDNDLSGAMREACLTLFEAP